MKKRNEKKKVLMAIYVGVAVWLRREIEEHIF